MSTNQNKQSMVAREYLVPFILITSLFFLWGGARAILDVLNKHVQISYENVGYSESALIQCSVYMAYFLGALPAGIIIRKYGTRLGVIGALLAFAVGAFLFIPAASFNQYLYLLLPLFVLGCGLVVLETAANPYVTLLGHENTSSSRINLSQSFNGLGSIFGALLGGLYFFSDGTAKGGEVNIAIPYAVIGVIVILAAIVFSRVKLPEVISETAKKVTNSDAAKKGLGATFFFGLLALLCYEVSEISINTFFINFMTDDDFLTKTEATYALSFGGLTLFMLGRFLGSWIMSRVRTEIIFFICACGTVLMLALVISPLGLLSKAALILTYVFESIMFPTIFALSIRGLGALTEKASSILMMSVVGGAIGPLALGYVADAFSITMAFTVPLAGFVVVWAFALHMLRKK